MRLLLAISLLCSPAFTQNRFSQNAAPPDNAASEAMQKRLQALKLLTGTLRPTTPLGVLATPARPSEASAPRVCAIPLLAANTSGFDSRMPVVMPPVLPPEQRESKAQVPAPACEPGLFQNR